MAIYLFSVDFQFETTSQGPIRVIEALGPSMRERKTSVIVNISSAEFWDPNSGAVIYASSKFAIEGASEASAAELSPLNIRILTVQSGGMKTAFFDPKTLKMPTILDARKGTITDYVLQAIAKLDSTAAQDPRKSAEAIVKEVLQPSSDPPLLRMTLGKESLGGIRKRVEEYSMIAEQVESVADSCDF